MSPAMSKKDCTPGSFPRVSGDEPAIKQYQEDHGGFSPRERG